LTVTTKTQASAKNGSPLYLKQYCKKKIHWVFAG